MILQKSFLHTDLLLKKHLFVSMLKTVVLLNIFVETMIHLFQKENRNVKKQLILDRNILCDVISVFTFTFDQLSASLMKNIPLPFIPLPLNGNVCI